MFTLLCVPPFPSVYPLFPLCIPFSLCVPPSPSVYPLLPLCTPFSLCVPWPPSLVSRYLLNTPSPPPPTYCAALSSLYILYDFLFSIMHSSLFQCSLSRVLPSMSNFEFIAVSFYLYYIEAVLYIGVQTVLYIGVQTVLYIGVQTVVNIGCVCMV